MSVQEPFGIEGGTILIPVFKAGSLVMSVTVTAGRVYALYNIEFLPAPWLVLVTSELATVTAVAMTLNLV